MLPLLAIGGVISAILSIGKGASWVADQVSPSGEASASAAKGAGKSQAANPSPFAAALAAQAAGQPVPGAGNVAPSASTALPSTALPGGISLVTHGTDYDALARIQAGVAAYGHVGERRGDHGSPDKTQVNGNDPTPPPANRNTAGLKSQFDLGIVKSGRRTPLAATCW